MAKGVHKQPLPPIFPRFAIDSQTNKPNSKLHTAPSSVPMGSGETQVHPVWVATAGSAFAVYRLEGVALVEREKPVGWDSGRGASNKWERVGSMVRESA